MYDWRCQGMSGDNRKPEMWSLGVKPTPAVAGQTHTWGSRDVEILSSQPTRRAKQNEDSVVKVVSDGESRFLFTRDIGTYTESTILVEGISVEADILEVAHYGSRHSSSSDFLEAVGAEVAVVCVGDNTYGHQTEEALERLWDAGAQVCRTDLHGTVVILSDGQTIEYTCGAGYVYVYVTFLPLVVSQDVPGAPPIPPPMRDETVVCEEIGNVQICGSVSNATPSQYSTVTVYGRYLVDGVGQAGQTMGATGDYETVTRDCSSVTGTDGIAECNRGIAGASKGYQVDVDVEINAYEVTTWLMPE